MDTILSNELEYIKLKFDWYKYVSSWLLAMIIGAVTFTRTINAEHAFRSKVLILLVFSVILLLLALIATLFQANALTHRLKKPYKTKWRVINFLLWVHSGRHWEAALGFVAGLCWGGGIFFFVLALFCYAAA